jgi:hypothetical protein
MHYIINKDFVIIFLSQPRQYSGGNGQFLGFFLYFEEMKVGL